VALGNPPVVDGTDEQKRQRQKRGDARVVDGGLFYGHGEPLDGSNPTAPVENKQPSSFPGMAGTGVRLIRHGEIMPGGADYNVWNSPSRRLSATVRERPATSTTSTSANEERLVFTGSLNG